MFECEVCLPQGRHEYKFLVDGQWKHNHTQVAGHSRISTLATHRAPACTLDVEVNASHNL